jgi:hypothetical protein
MIVKMAEKIIKSVSSTNHSYITFVNNHSDEASVLWYNFEGELVKYASIKEGGTYGVKTFVGHPWTAKDTQTGETLLTGGGKVFYPQSNPTVSEKIYITTPEGRDYILSLEAVVAVIVW